MGVSNVFNLRGEVIFVAHEMIAIDVDAFETLNTDSI